MSEGKFYFKVKRRLFSIIERMESSKSLYVVNPVKDFTRKRKLAFSEVIKLILSLSSGSLDKELLEYFNYDSDIVTSSAFVQKRLKILPETFSTLLRKFTLSFDDYRLYKGYRLVAVDGSDLHIPHNPSDKETYFKSTPNSKGFNLVHINAMYDLVNKIYLDARIQPGRKEHETKALTQMVNVSTLEEDVLLVADRAYESYNVFAHLIEKGWKFLIRVKDTGSRSMLSTFGLPETGEFDTIVHRIITRKQTKTVKAQPELYKFLPQHAHFDFTSKEQPFYPMDMRVVRVRIDDGSYQCFVTNLDPIEFSLKQIRELYHLRWGIETSFRELKHTLALTHLHSKKKKGIAQEIFAKMTMYNFCSIITSYVVIKKKDRKHDYQINFSKAISICRRFLTRNNANLDVEKLIQKYTLPIRKGRMSPRKVKFRTFVSFNYRIA